MYYIQNLMRHLKFVEDESQQMAYDDQKLSVTQFRAELERYVIEISMYTALMYRTCLCSTFPEMCISCMQKYTALRLLKNNLVDRWRKYKHQ